MGPAVGERRSLTIVLPCFDEAASVGAVVRQALEVGRLLADRIEVIVVDDGSTDDTPRILEALANENAELRWLRHSRNLGYGAALRAGFAQARGDLIFYTDADGQFDLSELRSLFQRLDRNDAVFGFRVARRDGPLRYACGRAWTALTHGLLGTGVRDVNCAFKVFPRSLIDEGALRSTGALLGAELASEARRRGLRVGQVGVTHLPRRAGRPTGARPPVIGRAFRELVGLVQARASAGLAPRRPSTPVEQPSRPAVGVADTGASWGGSVVVERGPSGRPGLLRAHAAPVAGGERETC